MIYGAGSFTTSISPNLGVLILGWSFLEGVGAVLIMPAVVALVASNFPAEARPRAYGLVASAGAVAVAGILCSHVACRTRYPSTAPSSMASAPGCRQRAWA